jgi:hypothetical protein
MITSDIFKFGRVEDRSSDMDDSLARRVPSDWDDQLEKLRRQLPQAPDGLQNFYVRWAPWLAIIFGVIGIIAFLSLTILSAIIAPLAVLAGGLHGSTGLGLILGSLLLLIASILELVGGLRMRQFRLTGWWFLAGSMAIQALLDVFNLAIVSLIIAALIFYIHLAVKPRYT